MFHDQDHTDPSYLPPQEALRIETRLQAQKALKSSYTLTERFWEMWKKQYLTALREQHRRNIDDKRGTTKEIREGVIVLLSDPHQKRNTWKMARITKLIPSNDGAVREVEVFHNKKTLRRPINQLIPLEIADHGEDSQQEKTSEKGQSAPQSVKKRYNLRSRRTTDNMTEHSQNQGNILHITSQSHKTWPSSLYLKMALTLAVIFVVNGTQPTIRKQIRSYSNYDYESECRKGSKEHQSMI
ncbi:DUF5641 domain-containing protein [Trichostrongylus colubriformis]|uniref:DUF5641 domain-containing protein n=1 Tax=Trichostrongylus colubriformis TaxID=6319 RepID=A0AAN8F0S1_TRICO